MHRCALIIMQVSPVFRNPGSPIRPEKRRA
jgi:hypothetical protein